MSRGDRVATSGNLQLSMRDNYAAHGVEEVNVENKNLLIQLQIERLPLFTSTIRKSALHTGTLITPA